MLVDLLQQTWTALGLKDGELVLEVDLHWHSFYVIDCDMFSFLVDIFNLFDSSDWIVCSLLRYYIYLIHFVDNLLERAKYLTFDQETKKD